MSAIAKLKLLFDNYSTSSKATRSFINYFMKNAALKLSSYSNDTNVEINVSDIYSHEGNKYKFLLRNGISGNKAVFEHLPDETFNYYIKAESAGNSEFNNSGWSLNISKDSDNNAVLLQAKYGNKVYIDYDASASRWTSDILNRLFPDGIPDGVDIENIKDFEPLLINNDFYKLYGTLSDTTCEKVNTLFKFSGDHFNYSDLPDDTVIELVKTTNAKGDLSSGYCNVNGYLKNSSTGEQLNISNHLTSVSYENGAAYVVLESKKEFNETNLQIEVYANANSIYGAVIQKHTALYTSGYNCIIPLVNKNNLEKLNSHQLYSFGNDPTSLLTFKTTDFYNDNDNIRLEFERADTAAKPHACNYVRNKVDLQIETKAPLSLYNNAKLKMVFNNPDLVITLHSRDGELLATDTIANTPWKVEASVLNSLEHIGQYCNFTKSSDPNDPSGFIQVSYFTDNQIEFTLKCTSMNVMIKMYKNDELYAQSYGWQTFSTINPDATNDDDLWLGTLTFSRLNAETSSSNPINKTIGNIALNVVGSSSEKTGLRLHFRTHNFGSTIGHMLIDLNRNEKLVYQFKPLDKDLIKSSIFGMPIGTISKESIPSSICLLKSTFNTGVSSLKVSDKDFNIPVHLKCISINKEDLDENVFPYLDDGLEITMTAPKGEINYTHKTKVFTINDSISAYYKIGFCALNGSNKSSEELANNFIENANFVVSHQNLYNSNISNRDYVLAVKPSSSNVNNELYCVSDTVIRNDLSNPILMSGCAAHEYEQRVYFICSAMLLPIIKVSRDLKEREPLGVIYMQLYDANTDEEITTNINDSSSCVITINGEDAMGKTIDIEKI